MTVPELERATIAELAPVIKVKKLSIVDLTSRFLDRIDRYNPALNAFQTVMADHALKQARTLDRELGAGEMARPAARYSFLDQRQLGDAWSENHSRVEATCQLDS